MDVGIPEDYSVELAEQGRRPENRAWGEKDSNPVFVASPWRLAPLSPSQCSCLLVAVWLWWSVCHVAGACGCPAVLIWVFLVKREGSDPRTGPFRYALGLVSRRAGLWQYVRCWYESGIPVSSPLCFPSSFPSPVSRNSPPFSAYLLVCSYMHFQGPQASSFPGTRGSVDRQRGAGLLLHARGLSSASFQPNLCWNFREVCEHGDRHPGCQAYKNDLHFSLRELDDSMQSVRRSMS